jgi:hypothetical protein
LYPDHARFAMLRNAVVEWTAYSEPSATTGEVPNGASLLDNIIEHIDAEEGAIDAFHSLALFDAGIAASTITNDPTFARRVLSHLGSVDVSSVGSRASRPQLRGDAPVYRLARDCGAVLKACAIKERLKARYPDADFDRAIAAARYNLDHGPSMEEWSFA